MIPTPQGLRCAGALAFPSRRWRAGCAARTRRRLDHRLWVSDDRELWGLIDLGLTDRLTYAQGTAESLPFPDDSFDMATCQTVLIHIADIRAVVHELARVVRPGGLLLVAEPNNRASVVVQTSRTAVAPINEIVDELAWLMACERGKKLLGEGDISAGDLVPGIFAEAGIVDIEVRISDRSIAMIPPYASPPEQAIIDGMRERAADNTHWWDIDTAHRFYLAGGGDPAAFDQGWNDRLRANELDLAAIDAGTFHSAGASIMYLIAGRVSE